MLPHLGSTWDTVVAVDGTLTVAVTIATTITVVIPTVIVATVNATVNPTLGATIGTTEIGTTTAGTGTGAIAGALLPAAVTPPTIAGVAATRGALHVAAAPLVAAVVVTMLTGLLQAPRLLPMESLAGNGSPMVWPCFAFGHSMVQFP